jgi:hypothetical protein
MAARFKQGVRLGMSATLAGALVHAGCSNSGSSCAAPSSGTFKVQLAYSQTIPVDLFCDAGDIDASACGAQPHPFDGTTWTVVVDGSTARVTTARGTWSCVATAPSSSPGSQPDGSTTVGTNCYLLVECGTQTVGDAGPAQIQLQILTKASTDAVVIAHDVGASCCTDEYTGSWN